MKNMGTMYTDVTCYESEMRYPTVQILLWEGCQRAYVLMSKMSERLGFHRPRTKYNGEKASMDYEKQREHDKGQIKKMLMFGRKLL